MGFHNSKLLQPIMANTLFPISQSADTPAVMALMEAAQDYVLMEERRAPDAAYVDNFFTERPKGHAPDALQQYGAGTAGDLDGAVTVLKGYNTADSWWVGLIILHPRARGTGLSARMMADLVAHARADGARWIKLAVLAQNARARAFYDRTGFTHERDAPAQPGGDGHDRIVLKLDLETFHET